MRRDTLDDANNVRAFLERMAREVPPGMGSPRPAVRRARRRLAGTVVTGFLVVSLAGYGAVVAVQSAFEPQRRVPAATAEMFAAGDLHFLVLREAPPHGGRPFVLADAGSFWSAPDIASPTGVSVSELQAAGLEDAYGNGWTTSEFLPTDGQKGMSLISIAMLFPDAESAARGLRLFSVASEQWERHEPLPADGLGDEGSGVRGRWDGLPSIGFVWRVDNVVLFVGSQGTLSPEVMRGLADEMDAQAFQVAAEPVPGVS